MKNLFKKIGSVLIGAAMLSTGLTGVYAEQLAVEATNGYFWLEGEDGAGMGEWYSVDNASYNGGKVMVISVNNDIENHNRVEFKINVTEAGNYKTYMNSTQAGYEWMSASALYIDDTEVNLTSVTGNTWCNSQWSLQWFSGNSVNLSEGVHTVTYKLTAPREHDAAVYIGALDSIAIMPEDYAMETAVGKKPVAPVTASFNNGYVWAELETAKSNVTLSEKSDAKFSGGKGYYMYIDNGVAAGTTHTFEYSVTFPKSASYRFAVNGTNNANEWSAPIKVKIDDGENVKLTSCGNAAWTSDNSGYQVGWNSADIDVTAGKHKVTVLINEPSTSGKTWNQYKYLLDALCISEADWDWVPSITNMPEEPKRVTAVWLEDTNATRKHTSMTTVEDTRFSGGTALRIDNDNTNPGENGYYVDYDVNIAADGTYDIYFVGPANSAWGSKARIFIDGTERELNVMTDDAGLLWHQLQHNAPWGYGKVTADMKKGSHTIRYTFIDPQSGNLPTYTIWNGLLDCMILVPADMPFTYTAQNFTATKADYNIVAAFANANQGIDLANVKSDIVLPATTEDGTEITWTSGNTNVIGNDGSVTRAAADTTVSLLAEYGDNQKSFSVTVKKISDFDVDSFTLNGTVAAGEKLTAKASVASEKGLTAMLLIALYDKDGKMLLADVDSKAAGASAIDYEISLTAPAGLETGAYAKAFLWSDVTTLVPIMPAITK